MNRRKFFSIVGAAAIICADPVILREREARVWRANPQNFRRIMTAAQKGDTVVFEPGIYR